MSKSITDLEQNIRLTRDIITQMHMQDDAQVAASMAEAEIELDGLRLNHPGVDEKVRPHLVRLHAHNISLKLEQVLRNCLAYYALAEQPVGTNEPPVGPVFAQQLLAKLDASGLSLMAVKDALHRHITML